MDNFLDPEALLLMSQRPSDKVLIANMSETQFKRDHEAVMCTDARPHPWSPSCAAVHGGCGQAPPPLIMTDTDRLIATQEHLRMALALMSSSMARNQSEEYALDGLRNALMDAERFAADFRHLKGL